MGTREAPEASCPVPVGAGRRGDLSTEKLGGEVWTPVGAGSVHTLGLQEARSQKSRDVAGEGLGWL